MDLPSRYAPQCLDIILPHADSSVVVQQAELKKPENERKDMYKHHAFSDLLHETCFRSTFDLGIVYEDVFDEYISLNTFAFICTMVC